MTKNLEFGKIWDLFAKICAKHFCLEICASSLCLTYYGQVSCKKIKEILRTGFREKLRSNERTKRVYNFITGAWEPKKGLWPWEIFPNPEHGNFYSSDLADLAKIKKLIHCTKTKLIRFHSHYLKVIKEETLHHT